jgi:hypothetical protein
MVDLFALRGSGRRGTSCHVMQIIADTRKNCWPSFAVFQVKRDGKRTVRRRVEQQKCKLSLSEADDAWRAQHIDLLMSLLRCCDTHTHCQCSEILSLRWYKRLRHPCTTCRDTAYRARVTPESLLGLREIEKDFPALVEVLKRFLDFGNRIDRGHRNGQRAGGDEGSGLDLRGAPWRHGRSRLERSL